jgi:hypothetical protein
LETQMFEHCCGMEEIGGLYGSAKDLRQRIATQLSIYADDREEGSDQTPGGLIATTVPEQLGAITALKFHKFRKVFTFTNPGARNKVTLWARKLVR